MKRTTVSALIVTMLSGSPVSAHPVGDPPFGFVCPLGTKAVRISTEGNELVYRYELASLPELTIRGSAKAGNLFFRHEFGGRSDAQQLRFVNGAYSYVLSSLFVAGGGEDRVRFSVLRGAKVIRTQTCRGAASFEDFDQLDALPHDIAEPVAD